MGVFRYPLEIAATPDGPFRSVDSVVDTGAFYTLVPASLLHELGVQPTFRRHFKIADGRTTERDVGEVAVRLEGRILHTLCVFGDEGSEPLLGAFTLEGFAVLPDPVNKRLTPLETLPLLASTDTLVAKHCVPCEGGMAPMARDEAERYLSGLPGWKLVDGEPAKITRSLKLKDFAQAMTFVNEIAQLAESEGHHPDICISWNRVRLELVTHAIGGLSMNDFIMAAKINELKAATR
jgi:4a-hydroxytetrahydrobiopterin dehydratase